MDTHITQSQYDRLRNLTQTAIGAIYRAALACRLENDGWYQETSESMHYKELASKLSRRLDNIGVDKDQWQKVLEETR